MAGNEREIRGLYPNRKYDIKVIAMYASAEDTKENWSEKVVAEKTSKCSSSFV